MRHKRLDLANRRLDARISSLESLATQGTLLAGFGYGTLTREDGAVTRHGMQSWATTSDGSLLRTLKVPYL